MSEHGCKCRLPHPTFAGENQDLVLNPGQAGIDERNVGIGTLWSGGTYCLVGAASACITFACLLRFRAGTVFCRDSQYVLAERVAVKVPGSGATSLGAAFNGASKSTWVGSSSEGAIRSRML